MYVVPSNLLRQQLVYPKGGHPEYAYQQQVSIQQQKHTASCMQLNGNPQRTNSGASLEADNIMDPATQHSA